MEMLPMLVFMVLILSIMSSTKEGRAQWAKRIKPIERKFAIATVVIWVGIGISLWLSHHPP